jgi:transmembrane sensor
MADNNNFERISQLLARKLAGEITGDEQEELHALLQQHSYASYVKEVLEHNWKDQYDYYKPEKVELLYQKHLGRLATALQEEAVEAEPLVEEGPKRSLRMMGWYIAAACIIAFFIGLWNWWPSEKTENTVIAYQKQITTEKGNRSQVVLPDGSKVWLNAGSTLDYPQQFSGKTRDVQLHGEAYFEVRENKEQPFLVHTNTFTIKVLGTGFNVRAYTNEDSAVAALVHGSIEVLIKGEKDKSILLQPNEKITLPTNTVANPSTAGKTVIPPLKALPEKMVVVEDTVQLETAWVNNKLAFKKTPLVTIAAMLENWFGTSIRFKNKDKENIRLSGVFEGESLDEILDYLQEAYRKFNYTKDKEGVIWIE